jgi:DUF1365 family protein
MPQSCLYDGEVMHSRLRPIQHRFVYRIFSMLLDLDELPGLDRRLRLFSYNRFNLFSFDERDHGLRDGSSLRAWVERHAAARDIDIADGKIFIHCLPRLLGYVFNPLSIIWCYDRTGLLRAILYEVKNTFGEQHGYLIPVHAGRETTAPILQQASKVFYVSPFIAMDADYHFRVHEPESELSVLIRETGPEGDILVATHMGQRRRLTDAGLVRAFLIYPLLTVKIFAGIRWEALRLWIKGTRLHKRPPPPSEEVTS